MFHATRDSQILDTYYSNGSLLRDKHRLAYTDSGREFHKWALGLVPIAPSTRILDAGCGWGRFLWPLIDDYGGAPHNVVGADCKRGMLHTASAEASERGVQVGLCAGDIEALPFAPRVFDGVLANHVLYHLPDIERGVRELARIVRPDGWLLATTNSDKVQVPVIELHYQALQSLGIPFVPEGPSPFSMENGDFYLRTGFRNVEAFYFEDEATYSNADDFVKIYQTIGRYKGVLSSSDVGEEAKRLLPEMVAKLAQDIISSEGSLRCPILMGAFVCANPINA